MTQGTAGTVAGVVSSAPTVTAAGAYKVTVGTPTGLATPTGTVTIKVAKGSTTNTITGALSGGTATISLPKLAPGTWTVAISWPGDSNYQAASAAGASIDVGQLKAKKVTGAVSKAPASKAAGAYKVTVTTPAGGPTATGKVTIKLKKGRITKTITGELSHGAVTFSVPKLALGTWTVAISWPGDANYLAVSATGAPIKVTK